jgi:hypothetical protein
VRRSASASRVRYPAAKEVLRRESSRHKHRGAGSLNRGEAEVVEPWPARASSSARRSFRAPTPRRPPYPDRSAAAMPARSSVPRLLNPTSPTTSYQECREVHVRIGLPRCGGAGANVDSRNPPRGSDTADARPRPSRRVTKRVTVHCSKHAAQLLDGPWSRRARRVTRVRSTSTPYPQRSEPG